MTKNKQKNKNRKEKNQSYIISPVHLAFIISIGIKSTAKLVLTHVTHSLKTYLHEVLNFRDNKTESHAVKLATTDFSNGYF